MPDVSPPIDPVEDTLPEFELVTVEAPATVTKGESYEIRLEVENTGGDGTFHGVIQYRAHDRWWELESASRSQLETEITSGETAEFVITNAVERSDEYTYRLAPFDEEWTTEIE